MTSAFVNVFQQSLTTFDSDNNASFDSNFKCLQELAQKLTYKDLYLKEEVFSAAVFEDADKAPCHCVDIFENDIVGMTVFILRAGYTMPLHDHPMMHGLIRVIHGQLNVKAYTEKQAANAPLVYNPNLSKVYVNVDEPHIYSAETECGILTPRYRNFHEITALNGVAAFLNILSPPYDSVMPVFGCRDCRFYEAISSNSTNNEEKAEAPILCLQRIPEPEYFSCDTIRTPKALEAAIIAKIQSSGIILEECSSSSSISSSEE